MNRHLLGLAVCAVACLAIGCTAPQASHQGTAMARAEYLDRPALTTSLFKSDQDVLSEAAISQIMSSKVVLPSKAKVAVMRFDDRAGAAARSFGHFYWRTEAYLRTQQEYVDSLRTALADSPCVVEVTIMPSLLIPRDARIPALREAAVRLQADLLLVFRITSDTYYQSRFLAADDVKAYSTCEAVLLDVRTGTIPFTTIVTREHLEQRSRDDLDRRETMQRAEKLAVLESLGELGKELTAFLSAAPQP